MHGVNTRDFGDSRQGQIFTGVFTEQLLDASKPWRRQTIGRMRMIATGDTQNFQDEPFHDQWRVGIGSFELGVQTTRQPCKWTAGRVERSCGAEARNSARVGDLESKDSTTPAREPIRVNLACRMKNHS